MAVTYKVDGRNRRVAKLVDGTFKRGWIYQDGLRVVGELDSTGALAIRYVYGSRSHVPDYLVRYGTTYRLITDQLGSVRQVVDASTGTVAEAVDYDAWGRITSQQSPGFVSVAYAGGLYDHHTGLTRFGARDYDASAGRWTCKDPIGFDGGATNLFEYSLGDPNNNRDISGLSSDIDEPRNVLIEHSEITTDAIADFVDGALPFVDPLEEAGVYDPSTANGLCWSKNIGAVTAAVATGLGAAHVAIRAAGISYRIALHGAHHRFPLLGLRRHRQLNLWRQGVAKSGRAFRMPLP